MSIKTNRLILTDSVTGTTPFISGLTSSINITTPSDNIIPNEVAIVEYFDTITGSTFAGGDDTEIQYNNGGILSGDTQFRFDKTLKSVVIGSGLATGEKSLVIGDNNGISGDNSLNIGANSDIGGNSSLNVGDDSTVNGSFSASIGFENTVSANNSVGFGIENISSGNYCGAFGYLNTASNNGAFSFGRECIASGQLSFAQGYQAISSGNYSHAEGYGTTGNGDVSHAEGRVTIASGNFSHAEGGYTVASSDYSHAEGNDTRATGSTSHAEGGNTIAGGASAHAEGAYTTALGNFSHAEGYLTTASGEASHAGGYQNTASGYYSAVIGGQNNLVTGEGTVVIASNGVTGTSDYTLYTDNLVVGGESIVQNWNAGGNYTDPNTNLQSTIKPTNVDYIRSNGYIIGASGAYGITGYSHTALGTSKYDIPSDFAVNAALTDGTKALSVASIQTNGTALATKVIEIGDWNMDATSLKNVAHGLTLANIRSVDVTIRSDNNSEYYPINSYGTVGATTPQYYITSIQATNVSIERVTGGFFDDTAFDSTGYNRGWVTITYAV